MLRLFPTVDERLSAAAVALQTEWGVDPTSARSLFLPYRIVPLGAHLDHQGGHILGRTIAAGTVLAYTPLNVPQLRLISRNFPESVTFDIGVPVQLESWGRYAQAAALALGEDYPLSRGFVGVVEGTLVGAGLSSSASVGLAYFQALADVNDIALTAAEQVQLNYRLEHDYLGLDNGIADQSVILFGRDDALTQIDIRQRQAHVIPDPPSVYGTGWLIAYSGVMRELTNGGVYNQRVAECRQAAQWLRTGAEGLSDVPPDVFARRSADMPDILRRRATHYFGEVARVSEGATAWAVGDVVRFGQLMNESCRSSIEQYQSGHPTTIALHKLMSEAPGVYGSRFSGGGQGGCVVGLAEESQAEEAAMEIMSRYRQRFSRHAESAAIYWVANGGGT